MSFGLRVVLIIGAAAMLSMVVIDIRRRKIRVNDSIFWVVIAGGFVLTALFPAIPSAISHLIGFQSPSNFVFLATIGILYVHGFNSDLKLSRLESKVEKLAQDSALK